MAGAKGTGDLQEVSQWFPRSRREYRVQALPEVLFERRSLLRELRKIVPVSLGQGTGKGDE